MSAIPDIILPKPYVWVQETNSNLGILPINSPMKFGTVALVYDTSDRVQIGQSVMFDSSKALQFIYGSTFYSQVSDEFITGSEVPIM